MADHPVLLSVSDDVYDQAERLARAIDQPVEDLLRRRLEEAFSSPLSRLPVDEQAELEALKFLSDDTLRTIAREQMSQPRQARMQILMDHNTNGTISPADYEELSQLVEQGQRLMLRKAQAANVLMDRGHKIIGKDFAATDE